MKKKYNVRTKFKNADDFYGYNIKNYCAALSKKFKNNTNYVEEYLFKYFEFLDKIDVLQYVEKGIIRKNMKEAVVDLNNEKNIGKLNNAKYFIYDNALSFRKNINPTKDDILMHEFGHLITSKKFKIRKIGSETLLVENPKYGELTKQISGLTYAEFENKNVDIIQQIIEIDEKDLKEILGKSCRIFEEYHTDYAKEWYEKISDKKFETLGFQRINPASYAKCKSEKDLPGMTEEEKSRFISSRECGVKTLLPKEFFDRKDREINEFVEDLLSSGETKILAISSGFVAEIRPHKDKKTIKFTMSANVAKTSKFIESDTYLNEGINELLASLAYANLKNQQYPVTKYITLTMNMLSMYKILGNSIFEAFFTGNLNVIMKKAKGYENTAMRTLQLIDQKYGLENSGQANLSDSYIFHREINIGILEMLEQKMINELIDQMLNNPESFENSDIYNAIYSAYLEMFKGVYFAYSEGMRNNSVIISKTDMITAYCESFNKVINTVKNFVNNEELLAILDVDVIKEINKMPFVTMKALNKLFSDLREYNNVNYGMVDKSIKEISLTNFLYGEKSHMGNLEQSEYIRKTTKIQDLKDDKIVDTHVTTVSEQKETILS